MENYKPCDGCIYLRTGEQAHAERPNISGSFCWYCFHPSLKLNCNGYPFDHQQSFIFASCPGKVVTPKSATFTLADLVMEGCPNEGLVYFLACMTNLRYGAYIPIEVDRTYKQMKIDDKPSCWLKWWMDTMRFWL